MSKREYSSYPFLYDDVNDLRCDFEILTDEISSQIGLLISFVDNEDIKQELRFIAEMVYHINPSLRKPYEIKDSEFDQILAYTTTMNDEYRHIYVDFVLPLGNSAASQSHVIRNKFKAVTRLLHRHKENGNEVDPRLDDITNLLSQYFFYLALKINYLSNVEEVKFVSRSYKSRFNKKN
jgi:cob(I)alamin adenosyltransferase